MRAENPNSTSERPLVNPEAIGRAIADIESLDARSVEISALRERIGSICRGHYRVMAPRFEAGLQLFRGRICPKPRKLSEISYPPDKGTTLGRVNRPGQTFFYCSTIREAPFFELMPEPGDTMTVSRWTTTSAMTANHVGYTATTFSGLQSARTHAGWDNKPAEIPGDEISKEIAEFLARTFAKIVRRGEEHHYKLSVAIAEELFLADVFDALLYPTIPMRANADNLAIKPLYVDSSLRFVKAEFVRIDRLREFGFDITVLDTATQVSEDGVLSWRGRLDGWVLKNQGDTLIFTDENGKWVARDKSGRVVEAE